MERIYLCFGHFPEKDRSSFPISREPINRQSEGFPLTDTKVGDRLRIIKFQSPKSMDCLFSLGCVPGVELQVVSRTPEGSVIVSLRDRQLGIGAAIAHQIWVCFLTEKL